MLQISRKLRSFLKVSLKVLLCFFVLFCFALFLIGRSTLVGQRPRKSLLSVCPSLIFLKIGSLVFSDNVHHDS